MKFLQTIREAGSKSGACINVLFRRLVSSWLARWHVQGQMLLVPVIAACHNACGTITPWILHESWPVFEIPWRKMSGYLMCQLSVGLSWTADFWMSNLCLLISGLLMGQPVIFGLCFIHCASFLLSNATSSFFLPTCGLCPQSKIYHLWVWWRFDLVLLMISLSLSFLLSNSLNKIVDHAHHFTSYFSC